MPVLRRTVLVLACWSAGLLAVCLPAKGGPAWGFAFLAVAVVLVPVAARSFPAAQYRARIWEISVSLFFFCVVGAIAYPVYLGSRPVAARATCISHEKEMATAMAMYELDFDGRFPPAASWSASTRRYEGPVVPKCPEAKTPYSYALNRAIDAQPQDEFVVPETTVLTFEADAQAENALGDRESFVKRHGDFGTMSFVDGHVVATTTEAAFQWPARLHTSDGRQVRR